MRRLKRIKTANEKPTKKEKMSKMLKCLDCDLEVERKAANQLRCHLCAGDFDGEKLRLSRLRKTLETKGPQ